MTKETIEVVKSGTTITVPISAKAKGILTSALDLPVGCEINVVDLIAEFTDGEKSIRSGLRELIRAGYVTTQRLRGADGRIIKIKYTAYATPEQNPAFGGRDSSEGGEAGGRGEGGENVQNRRSEPLGGFPHVGDGQAGGEAAPAIAVSTQNRRSEPLACNGHKAAEGVADGGENVQNRRSEPLGGFPHVGDGQAGGGAAPSEKVININKKNNIVKYKKYNIYNKINQSINKSLKDRENIKDAAKSGGLGHGLGLGAASEPKGARDGTQGGGIAAPDGVGGAMAGAGRMGDGASAESLTGFNELAAIWPKAMTTESRLEALEAYLKAVGEGMTHRVIMKAAGTYLHTYQEQNGTSLRFLAQLKNWLTQGGGLRWNALGWMRTLKPASAAADEAAREGAEDKVLAEMEAECSILAARWGKAVITRQPDDMILDCKKRMDVMVEEIEQYKQRLEGGGAQEAARKAG